MSGWRDDRRTIIAPGVTREDYSYGYYLKGTKDDLVRAGLAKKSWFANGQRDKRGRVIRSIYTEHEGRNVRCTEQQGKGHYSVEIDFTDAEQEARKNAEVAAKAETEARRQLDDLPRGAQGYLKQIVAIVEGSIAGIIVVSSHSKRDGYRLHPDTLAEIERIAGHLVAAVEEGKVVFNPADRAAVERKIRAEFAAHDPGLQKFMQSLTAMPGSSAMGKAKH